MATPNAKEKKGPRKKAQAKKVHQDVQSKANNRQAQGAAAARAWIARGFSVVPIPFREKGPKLPNWQHLDIKADEVDKYFLDPMNVGLILGRNNLRDVDPDCAEAVLLAPYFLPATNMIFGRMSKKRSHYLYFCDDCEQLVGIAFKDEKNAVLIELRLGAGGKGAQTMAPGSVHPNGEFIEHVESGDPCHVPYAELKAAVIKIAVGALLLRGWPTVPGSRHNMALTCGAFFARAGWEVETIKHFMHAVCKEADDDDVQDRVATAADSAQNFLKGEQTHGLPMMKETFGDAVVDLIAKWIDYPHDEGFTAEQSAEITRLAALHLLQYELERAAAAKKLGLRKGVLDAIVASHRPRSDNDTVQGTALTLDEAEPWPDPVDGMELITNIEAVVREHVILSEQQALSVALWTVHTYAQEVAEHFPLLHLYSPAPRCGKTTLMNTIAAMACKSLSTENISLAALFRVVEMASPTLLIDEVDAFLKDHDEIRGMLNSGHARNGRSIRVVGDNLEPRAFKVSCPKVVSGIGTLPGALVDRTITIALRRKLPEEKVTRLRTSRTEHLHVRGRQAARWVADHYTELDEMDPTLPEELNDRAQDNWRPLIAIADLCGLGKRAREVAITLAEENIGADERPSQMILADVAALFEAKNVGRLRSKDIVAHLITLDERPWPKWRKGEPLTENSLARLLRPYHIRPVPIRFDDAAAKKPGAKPVQKGYHRQPVVDARDRYVDDTEAVEEQAF